jgi:hypothetical protein
MRRKAIVGHQTQSPLAWAASEGGLFLSDSQFGAYTVMMDAALLVKLHLISHVFSIFVEYIHWDCSCVVGLSARPNRLDIDGKEHFGASSTGGDGGA